MFPPEDWDEYSIQPLSVPFKEILDYLRFFMLFWRESLVPSLFLCFPDCVLIFHWSIRLLCIRLLCLSVVRTSGGLFPRLRAVSLLFVDLSLPAFLLTPAQAAASSAPPRPPQCLLSQSAASLSCFTCFYFESQSSFFFFLLSAYLPVLVFKFSLIQVFHKSLLVFYLRVFSWRVYLRV